MPFIASSSEVLQLCISSGKNISTGRIFFYCSSEEGLGEWEGGESDDEDWEGKTHGFASYLG